MSLTTTTVIISFILLYRKHAKVDDSGIKFEPAELSREDIEAAKKEWETITVPTGRKTKKAQTRV
jgi:hypothetical protein